MGSSGTIRLSVIKEALGQCLPGCRWESGKHRWHVYPPNGGACFHMPTGDHGSGERAEIQRGHVKKMARQFKIEECMRSNLPSF